MVPGVYCLLVFNGTSNQALSHPLSKLKASYSVERAVKVYLVTGGGATKVLIGGGLHCHIFVFCPASVFKTIVFKRNQWGTTRLYENTTLQLNALPSE